MKVAVGVRTDIGRARERNEDSYLIQDPLYAVADGMGGHRGGDVASALAIQILKDAGWPEEGQGGPLVDAVKQANQVVLERGEADRDLRGMGTTLTALLADGGRAHLAHVGDSRAYLLRDRNDLQQLTEDHTLVQRLVREGKIQPGEVHHHPQRSMITRALGVDEDIDVDLLTLDVHPGDRILLCTDGLTNMVGPDRIEEILGSADDPQTVADRLVDAANRAGGDDNITVVVLDFQEDALGEPSDGAATVSGPVGRSSATGPSTALVPNVDMEDSTLVGALPPVAAPETDGGPPPSSRPASGRPGVRWGRVVTWVVAIVAVAGALLVGARVYIGHQWYVGESNGRVAIFNGIPSTVAGYHLSHVKETTTLDAVQAERLQPWRDLKDGITAQSLTAARSIVEQIRSDVGTTSTSPGAGPSPSPEPSPSAAGTGG